MKRLTIGVLAHVDAGKTTLNECLAYHGNLIRKMGRVDNEDSFFDVDKQERQRGITIFSKCANFQYNDTSITIIDTPGHVDFSSEMERSLQVIDQAIVVISGLDKVQSHSKTIVSLLEHYQIPYWIFVNKMDITSYSKDELIIDLQKNLSDKCLDFSKKDEHLFEEIATKDDSLMNYYFENGSLNDQQIANSIENRKIVPVYFGSALKNDNTKQLLDDITRYQIERDYPNEFGMKIFKISYDQQLTRLCFVKITGGSLSSKTKLSDEEKVDQIRLYNADKFVLLNEAVAGQIVALKGLSGFTVGQGFGIEDNGQQPILNPLMNYRVILPKGCDDNAMMKQLQMLQQQDPQIQVSYDEQLHEIHLAIMGDIQIEVITNLIKERSGVDIKLDNGRILFKETIEDCVLGLGHYEPLRHFADVRLRLEPLERNSGLVFDSEVSTDDLALNWQRLILTHLKEKTHRGVLTGSPLTDCKITLIGGKAHLKHTEGGDFRQATYRAVRYGLKMAHSILLEPYYEFTITTEQLYLSKIIYELDNMKAQYRIDSKDERMLIIGKAPVRLMQNYQTTLASLSSGSAHIEMAQVGYEECKDASDIIEHIGYDSENDYHNPTGSVFCKAGSGFYVPYNHVAEYMDVETEDEVVNISNNSSNRFSISDEELRKVVGAINGRNYKEKKKKVVKQAVSKMKPVAVIHKPKYMIVDGYNMMFGWNKSRDIAKNNYDNARDLVINCLANYAGYNKINVCVVFDAYKVNGGIAHKMKDGYLEIVYSGANQTADSYIEKLVHDKLKEYEVVVASSDMAVQNVIFGQGATRMSARELENEIDYINSSLK